MNEPAHVCTHETKCCCVPHCRYYANQHPGTCSLLKIRCSICKRDYNASFIHTLWLVSTSFFTGKKVKKSFEICNLFFDKHEQDLNEYLTEENLYEACDEFWVWYQEAVRSETNKMQ